MEATSSAWMTASWRTLQKSAIFLRSEIGTGRSQRHRMMSGWMPIDRSSFTECWVGLVLSSPALGMKGSSVRWMKTVSPRGSSLPSWRMASKNGRPSMSHRAADLHQHEVEPLVARGDELLDGVGDVRDHLHGAAQIVAAPLAGQNVLVDAPRGDVVALRRRHAGEALVVAEVEVGLRPVVGHEHLTVLVGAHGAGVDVEIGVELPQPDPVAAGLEKRSEGR